MVEQEGPFSSFVNKIDFEDPTGLAKLKLTEKIELLHKNERLLARAAISSCRVIDLTFRTTRGGVVRNMAEIYPEDGGFVSNSTDDLVELVNDQVGIAAFFRRHEINKGSLDLGFSGNHTKPDSRGIRMTYDILDSTLSRAVDRRLGILKEPDKESLATLKMYTDDDITCRRYAQEFFLPRYRTMYLDALSSAKPETFEAKGDTPKERIQSAAEQSASRDGLGYPAALLAVYYYDLAIEWYLDDKRG